MFSRKTIDGPYIDLPHKWIKEVHELFNNVYSFQCKKYQKDFEIYGQQYPSELLLIVSFVDQNKPEDIPVTCFLSVDIEEGEKQDKETLNKLIDVAGAFFDTFFLEDDWSEFIPHWQEDAVKGQKFYYKVTRENVALTLQANALLK